MKVSREKEGGKTNIVCVYTYMASLRGEVAKDKTKGKKNEPPPLS